jgi:hypothetical protein
LEIFSDEIHAILWSNIVIVFYFWMPNLYFCLIFIILIESVLLLGLKFCKNLGFSQSEHCEYGTWLALVFSVTIKIDLNQELNILGQGLHEG